MGLKSGSRDADLDDSDAGGEAATDDRQRPAERSDAPERSPPSDRSTDAGSPTDGSRTDAAGGRPTMASIPYKLRRERVNEGRDQVPFFLREEIVDAEDDLQDSLETMLGEDVYKSDYREAAMIVAQRNPELVAEVLREWGYDLDAV